MLYNSDVVVKKKWNGKKGAIFRQTAANFGQNTKLSVLIILNLTLNSSKMWYFFATNFACLTEISREQIFFTTD